VFPEFYEGYLYHYLILLEKNFQEETPVKKTLDK